MRNGDVHPAARRCARSRMCRGGTASSGTTAYDGEVALSVRARSVRARRVRRMTAGRQPADHRELMEIQGNAGVWRSRWIGDG